MTRHPHGEPAGAARRRLPAASQPAAARWSWQRHVLGVLAVVLLVAGGIHLIFSGADATQSPLLAACWRMGVVFGGLWLALPQLAGLRMFRNRLWLGGLVVFVIILWRWPRLLPAVLLGLVVLALLRPRTGRAGGS